MLSDVSFAGKEDRCANRLFLSGNEMSSFSCHGHLALCYFGKKEVGAPGRCVRPQLAIPESCCISRSRMECRLERELNRRGTDWMLARETHVCHTRFTACVVPWRMGGPCNPRGKRLTKYCKSMARVPRLSRYSST